MIPASLSRFHGKPWLIEAEALQTLIEKTQQEPGAFFDIQLPPKSTVADILSVESGVAVVSVQGVMMRDTDEWDEARGATSSRLIQQAIEQATSDPGVSQILLHIDSPGGQVAGTQEAAQAVVEAAKKKTVYAYTDGLMCSAAYWLASGANAIYGTPSSRIGSIGVLLAFIDWSKAFEEAGLKTEVIAAGKFKAAGVMGTSLTDDQRANLQAGVDEIMDEFRAAVLSRGRSIPAEAMEGQTFSAKQAQKFNLAGRVTGLADVLARMKTLRGIDMGTGGSGRTTRAVSHTDTMTIEEQLSGANAELATLKTQLADAQTALEQANAKATQAEQALTAEKGEREKAESALQEEMEKAESAAKNHAEAIAAKDKQISDLEAKEQDIEKRAAEKAAKITASGGAPLPVAGTQTQQPARPVSPLALINQGRTANR